MNETGIKMQIGKMDLKTKTQVYAIHRKFTLDLSMHKYTENKWLEKDIPRKQQPEEDKSDYPIFNKSLSV